MLLVSLVSTHFSGGIAMFLSVGSLLLQLYIVTHLLEKGKREVST